MPAPEEMDRYQLATLWEFVGRYDRQSVPVVYPPVEILVQWDHTYRQIRNPDNTVVTIEADVMVGQDIKINSILSLGGLDVWGDLGTGTVGSRGELMQVVRVGKIPSINYRVFERTVMLARYKNILPPVVQV